MDANLRMDMPQLRQPIARIGFLATGACLLYYAEVFWLEGRPVWNHVDLALALLTSGLAFLMLVLGMVNRIPDRAVWLILIGSLCALLFAYGVRLGDPRITPSGLADSGLFSDYAANLQLLGENPYEWDERGAFTSYRLSTFYSTPTLGGVTSTRFQYPALHFLVPIPFKLLGWTDVRAAYVFAHSLLLAVLFLSAPGLLRPVILLPLLVNRQYIDYTLGGVTDMAWALLLACAVANWRRPTWRAVFFGLACAYKQLPWLLAPFIVARLLLDSADADRRPSLQRAAYFAAVSLSTFLAVNAPYLLSSPGAWASGVFEPMLGPLSYFGNGLSSLTQSGAAALPKAFYMVSSLLAVGVLLLLYVINFEQLRHAMWVFPGLVLWFSYRGLQSYYIYWVPSLLAAVAEMTRANGALMPIVDRARPLPMGAVGGVLAARLLRGLGAANAWLGCQVSALQSHRHASLKVGAAGIALAAGLGILSLYSVTPLEVRLVELELGEGASPVSEMEISIHNTGSGPVSPRIAVQKGIWQPYAWEIESGPESLQPGQRANYHVKTDLPYRMVDLGQGAQVVVTDASGDYRRRGTLRIPPDRSLIDPDAIYNAAYLRGPRPDSIQWGWYLDPRGAAAVRIRDGETTRGFRGVELAFSPEPGRADWQTVGLSQWILFPTGELSVWVRPPASANWPRGVLSTAYGLEFDDGVHRLWVLVGSGSGQGWLGPNHYYIYRHAPSETWSQQRIDLDGLYASLGWPLPPVRRVVRGDLELTTRMVTMRLLLGSRALHPPLTLAAQFGPIAHDLGPNPVRDRVAELVSHPDEYALASAGPTVERHGAKQALKPGGAQGVVKPYLQTGKH